ALRITWERGHLARSLAMSGMNSLDNFDISSSHSSGRDARAPRRNDGDFISRPSLWDSHDVAQSGVYGGGDFIAGARHRRQHVDLQPRQCGAAAALALPEP